MIIALNLHHPAPLREAKFSFQSRVDGGDDFMVLKTEKVQEEGLKHHEALLEETFGNPPSDKASSCDKLVNEDLHLMRVIPVLDLLGGIAVHARRGERETYQKLQGVLIERRAAAEGRPYQADPLDLIQAFREKLGRNEVYIADLDAIQGKGDNLSLIAEIAREASMDLLVDAGVRRDEEIRRLLDLGVEKVIVASETMEDLGAVSGIVERFGRARLIFSMDTKGRRVLWGSDRAPTNPDEVAARIKGLGINEVILLEMERIGTEAGVDIDFVTPLIRKVPELNILVGGGIRDKTDLIALKRIGASGALVATAFHTGRITQEDLHWIGG